jgi:hypothetical protein
MKLDNINKIFLLGDLHLGIRNNSIEWSKSQSQFLIDFFCEKVDELGFNPDTDILIQEGDWFHNRENTNNRIWKDSLGIFEHLSAKFKRGIYIILGNHDVYYKDNNNIHSLMGIEKMFDNIHVFEKSEILIINDSHRFLMLPWIDDEKKITAEVKKYVGKTDYLICHADIKTFQLNKWVKLQSGLDKSSLKKFKRVYSGHIHTRQEDGNVLYTGTPYELDRGDRGNVKGFYTLDVSKKEISETFTENIFSSKHVKFDASALLELKIDEIKKKFHNNFVDIMIPIDKARNFPVTRFMELIDNYGHRRIEFFTYSSDLQREKLDKELDYRYSEIKEYDIYEIFQECLLERKYPKSMNKVIESYFKKLHDSVKNNEKDYE